MTIRQKQSESWEELLMLEMRVLCKFLPQNFDDLENFTAPNMYSPVIHNSTANQFKNKRYKIIQEAKRQWLNITFYAYEIKIQEYEQQYQYELLQLESQLLNSITVDGSSVLNKIKEYVTYQTEQLKNDIYTKMSAFRGKLLRRRQRSSLSKTTTGVSPEPYLDVISNPFKTREWNHLSLGKTFSRIEV